MPDIFGREPEEYAVIRQMQEDKTWDRYQEAHAERRPDAEPTARLQRAGQWCPRGIRTCS